MIHITWINRTGQYDITLTHFPLFLLSSVSLSSSLFLYPLSCLIAFGSCLLFLGIDPSDCYLVFLYRISCPCLLSFCTLSRTLPCCLSFCPSLLICLVLLSLFSPLLMKAVGSWWYCHISISASRSHFSCLSCLGVWTIVLSSCV